MAKQYPNRTDRFRGDVAAALNKLVAAGRIASFRTNLTSGRAPEHLEIHVVPMRGQESGTEKDVLRALGSLVEAVQTVTIKTG